MNTINKLFYSKKGIDFGLLFTRVLIGLIFILHGIIDIISGKYVHIAENLELAGLGIFGEFGVLLAKLIETIGGFFLILGFFTKIVALKIAFVMLIATISHYNIGGIKAMFKVSYPFSMMIIFIGIIFTGAGKYSLDAKIFKN